jgi:hypothetical protein
LLTLGIMNLLAERKIRRKEAVLCYDLPPLAAYGEIG